MISFDELRCHYCDDPDGMQWIDEGVPYESHLCRDGTWQTRFDACFVQ